MKVLSCMGMNQPYVMVARLPKLITGCFAAKMNILKIWWNKIIGQRLLNLPIVLALIWSIRRWGIMLSMIDQNYEYRNLNGQYALMSRQASKAADKGMVVV